MCQPGTTLRSNGLSGCTCGCCGSAPSFRSFFSSEEKRECLENYRNQLTKELTAVEECIKECKCG